GDEAQSPVAVPPSPAERTTTTTAPAVPVPDTSIASGPPAHTVARSAEFRFRAVAHAAKSFECSVDAGPFTACASPADLNGLAPGDHLFSVRAVSAAGEPDGTPATYRWTVLTDLQPSAPQPQAATPAPAPKPKPKVQPRPV